MIGRILACPKLKLDATFEPSGHSENFEAHLCIHRAKRARKPAVVLQRGVQLSEGHRNDASAPSMLKIDDEFRRPKCEPGAARWSTRTRRWRLLDVQWGESWCSVRRQIDR
jgi:hypothetical protein